MQPARTLDLSVRKGMELAFRGNSSVMGKMTAEIIQMKILPIAFGPGVFQVECTQVSCTTKLLQQEGSNIAAVITFTETLTCTDNEFACKNGFKCISKRQMCDGRNDCFDGSDEDPVECTRENILDGKASSVITFETIWQI